MQEYGHDQFPYPEHHWPVTGQYTQLPTPGSSEYFFLLRDFGGSSAHRPQTVPLDYWGNSESGTSANTFYVVSALT
jgi:hypothetical protein